MREALAALVLIGVMSGCAIALDATSTEPDPPSLIGSCGYVVCAEDVPLDADHPACTWTPPVGEGRYDPNPYVDPTIPYAGQYGICPLEEEVTEP